VFCGALALIQVLTLYGVSVGTSLHLFTPRHELASVSGIVLCWALLISQLRSRILRLLFCAAIVAATASLYLHSPSTSSRKDNTWKYAIEVVQNNSAVDHAPVLLCSNYVESGFEAMPVGRLEDSPLFAPLAYYKLTAPIVPLPEQFTDQTKQIGSRFLQESAQKHERFLAVASRRNSYETLDWLTQNAAATYFVHNLGTYGGMEVLEFVPRTEAAVTR
jgi:hypothetical protein